MNPMKKHTLKHTPKRALRLSASTSMGKQTSSWGFTQLITKHSSINWKSKIVQLPDQAATLRAFKLPDFRTELVTAAGEPQRSQHLKNTRDQKSPK